MSVCVGFFFHTEAGGESAGQQRWTKLQVLSHMVSPGSQ